MSLMAPFVAYLPAEEVHASGVIAVVTAGLILGHKAPIIQDATSRLNERINWETIQFLLENSVFLLIGLQVREILDGVGDSELSPLTIAVFCVGGTAGGDPGPAALGVPGRLLPDPADGAGATSPTPGGRRPSCPGPACAGWSRWPPRSCCPTSIPNVEMLVLGAFVVTAGTLLLQGLSLPWLARRLRIEGPDEREDALAEATGADAAVEAGRAELDRIRVKDADDDPEMLQTPARPAARPG